MSKCRLKQILTEIFAIVIIVSGILMIGSLLVGCTLEDEILARQISELKTEAEELKLDIIRLEAEKSQLKNEVTDLKVETGTAKYIITINIAQKHPWYDIENNIKDSMNAISLQIPVDKEYYDNLQVGDILNDSFRMGSLIMSSSIGSWNVTIENKEIK